MLAQKLNLLGFWAVFQK